MHAKIHEPSFNKLLNLRKGFIVLEEIKRKNIYNKWLAAVDIIDQIYINMKRKVEEMIFFS